MQPISLTKKSEKFGSRGFTLMELLVVLTIISVLVSLLFPALSRIKTLSKRITCVSNLKNWGAALNMYRVANHDCYPLDRDSNWADPQQWPHGPTPISYQDINTRLAPYLGCQVANWSVPGGFEHRIPYNLVCPIVVELYKGVKNDLQGYAYNNTLILPFPNYPDFPTWPNPMAHPEVHQPAGTLVPDPGRRIAFTCNAFGGTWHPLGTFPNVFSLRTLPFDAWGYEMTGPAGFHGGVDTLWDDTTKLSPGGQWRPVVARPGVDNYVYCDGHVQSLNPVQDIDKIDDGWFGGWPNSDYLPPPNKNPHMP